MSWLYISLTLLYAYCVYHAYKTSAEQRWYWLILFLPVVGCVLYLAQVFANQSTADIPNDNLRESTVSTHRIGQLESAVEFNDSVTNKEALADAYIDVRRYKDAVPLYVSCLQGFMAGDPAISMKLLYAYFMDGNYAEAVELGNLLKSEKGFRDSEARLAYAWALYRRGDKQKAEAAFVDMDRSFTNYHHRFEYSKFLVETASPTAAKAKLSELLEEFDQMKDTERRQTRSIQRDIKMLHETLVSPA